VVTVQLSPFSLLSCYVIFTHANLSVGRQGRKVLIVE